MTTFITEGAVDALREVVHEVNKSMFGTLRAAADTGVPAEVAYYGMAAAGVLGACGLGVVSALPSSVMKELSKAFSKIRISSEEVSNGYIETLLLDIRPYRKHTLDWKHTGFWRFLEMEEKMKRNYIHYCLSVLVGEEGKKVMRTVGAVSRSILDHDAAVAVSISLYGSIAVTLCRLHQMPDEQLNGMVRWCYEDSILTYNRPVVPSGMHS